MDIKSAKYQVSVSTGKKCSIQTTIDGVEWSVPLDPANRHYAAILKWAEEDGNTIQEAD